MRNTEIISVEAYRLNVPLLAPFTIATARVDHARNVAVRIVLADGAVGWGEAPTLLPVTREDQPAALAGVEEAGRWLLGQDASAWRPIAAELQTRMPYLTSVRAGVEMALLDALACHHGVPLARWFGGSAVELETDITIPICPPDEAQALARRYADEGFRTVKTKVGLNTAVDIERLAAIRSGHPTAALVLDANEGYTASEALRFIRDLRGEGIEPMLFEQPVAREDWDGLARVTREAGVQIAADESCRTSEEAWRVAAGGFAHVLNIKLAKSGVVNALAIAEIAKGAGLGLMIGGMVETRLAMGFAVHFAAGLGGFAFIDLDTPLLLAADPVVGGYEAAGPWCRLAGVQAGHGGRLRIEAS